MITKSEWQNAYRDPLEKEQERAGPPPTEEQLDRLQQGLLSDEDAERVREQLSYYPDIARVWSAPFPEENQVLTDEEVEADLALLRQRIQSLPREPKPVPFPARRPWRVLAVAAAIFAVVATAGIALWLASHGETRDRTSRILIADGHRGAGAQTPIQLSTARDYLLKPVFRPARSYLEYRLDLLQGGPASPHLVWSRGGIQRNADGSYPTDLSTASLEPGLYELVLYGVEGDQVDRLAAYTLRLSAR
jgi:hypothetical protein